MTLFEKLAAATSVDPTTQKFTLWPDGTFKIEKHNHWAQRTIWNDYLIDGISVLNGVGE